MDDELKQMWKEAVVSYFKIFRRPQRNGGKLRETSLRIADRRSRVLSNAEECDRQRSRFWGEFMSVRRYTAR
jgi:hypothetical protein